MTRFSAFYITLLIFCTICATSHADSFLSRLNPWHDTPQKNTRWMPLDEGRTWHYNTTLLTVYDSMLDRGITTVVVDTLTTFDLVDPTETTAVLLYTNMMMEPFRREYMYYDDSPWKLMNGNGTTLFDFTALPGDITSVRDEKREIDGYTYWFSTTITYLGSDNISVPAGTFENCRKYQSDSLGFSKEKDNIEIGYQSSETVWFARGVGIVMIDKTTENVQRNNTERTIFVLKQTKTEYPGHPPTFQK